MEEKDEFIHIKISGAVLIAIALISVGILVYHNFEGWSYIDSLYFSVTTLTTVGYGDLHPTNDASKIFTVIYIFFGVSIILYLLSVMGGYITKKRSLHIEQRVYSALSGFRKKKQTSKNHKA